HIVGFLVALRAQQPNSVGRLIDGQEPKLVQSEEQRVCQRSVNGAISMRAGFFAHVADDFLSGIAVPYEDAAFGIVGRQARKVMRKGHRHALRIWWRVVRETRRRRRQWPNQEGRRSEGRRGGERGEMEGVTAG